MVWSFALVVLAFALVLYGFSRFKKRPKSVFPEHQQPIEGNADVVAARLEHIAKNLEDQADQLRQAVAEVKGESRTEPTKGERGERGPAGAKGDQGEQGEQGLTGQQGKQGERGKG